MMNNVVRFFFRHLELIYTFTTQKRYFDKLFTYMIYTHDFQNQKRSYHGRLNIGTYFLIGS